MSLKKFIRDTRLLIQQGLYETRKASGAGHQRALQLTRLEDRVLFSASAVAPVVAEIAEVGGGLMAAAAPADDNTLYQVSDQQLLDLVADSVLPPSTIADSSSAAPAEHTLELVFVDSSVSNLDQMILDLKSESLLDNSRTLEFVILDSQRDGIAQITSALLRYNGVDGLHIVSHGDTGRVQLGSTILSLDNLDRYRSAITAWQYSMSDRADILFYGCNLGQTESGQALMQTIGDLTETSVSASDSDLDFSNTPTRESAAVLSQSSRHEIAILDSGVQNSSELLNLLATQQENGRDLELFVLDRDRDGLEQISEILSRFHDLDAVHILSHGTAEGLQLGSTWIDSGTIGNYEAALRGWQSAFGIDGDMLLYGCDLAASDDGRQIVNAISNWTQTDVAASTDVTGSSLFGGNWDLEFQTGHIEAMSVADQQVQDDWVGLMAVSVDSVTSGSTSSGASVTVSHTTGGTNRLMLVGISMAPEGESVTSVKWNGVNLTRIGVEENSAGKARVEIWQLVAPQTGTYNVVVNFTGTSHKGATVGVATFTGVNQSNPTLAFSSASGNSNSASTTVASATNDVVFGVVQSHNGTSVSPGSGQTEYWDINTNEANGEGTVKAGAASVTSSWTVQNDKWSAAAVSIQADTNNTQVITTTPVQDSYIQFKNPTTNSGTSSSLIVDRETNDLQRALVQFDLSSIPVGSTIQSATLRLTSTAIDGSLNIGAYQLQQSWVEGSTTWNQRSSGTNWTSAGSTYNSTAVDTINKSTTGQHSFNITTLAQAWLAGTQQNYGVMVASMDGGGIRTVTYDSREGTTAPVLQIIYTLPPNTAPVLDSAKSPALTSLNEDSGAPSGSVGTLVSSLVDFASPSGQVDNVTDPDSGALLGIAVTAADTTNGSWFYSTNSGTNWNALGAVASNNARLLASDTNTRLYFQPNANYNGTLASAVTFRAWDQTSGSNGTLADTSTNGGITAFSTVTDTASLVINAVNDAPVLDNTGTMSLGTITEDGSVNAWVSTVVATAGGDRITDVDAGAVEGIAITSVNNGNGTWRYSTDGGSTWSTVGPVSNTSALLLRANDFISYVGDNQNGGTADFQFRAWDQTSGTQGTKVDTSVNGGTSAFSTAIETAYITSSSVN
ncbi:MAG TPA: DUF4347 domain-containing protein, partial [Planctomycetaceae bacterium]|nr:DUF4347 domain-containing protein [Planctomycetaceae bacterium]